MDIRQYLYGYDKAVLAALEAYEQAQRGSGRTFQMLAACQPGDRVIMASAEPARSARRNWPELKAEIVAGDPIALPLPHQSGFAQARKPTVADHYFVYLRLHTGVRRLAHELQHEIAHINGAEMGLPHWPLRRA